MNWSTRSAPALDPAWQTDTAVTLARTMYDSRDFSAMSILADALQDAGCANADILDHCRGEGPHVRGCWVVDLVLGKGSPGRWRVGEVCAVVSRKMSGVPLENDDSDPETEHPATLQDVREVGDLLPTGGSVSSVPQIG